ncbi:MAG: CcoQ/FixQ family Cbb3-type cytochrome c oxidase assembly chaperone [Steroidobacteraceae bacterium]
MDIGVVRGLITLALMAAFITMVVMVWSRRRSAEFESAARLPLEDLPPQQQAVQQGRE